MESYVGEGSLFAGGEVTLLALVIGLAEDADVFHAEPQGILPCGNRKAKHGQMKPFSRYEGPAAVRFKSAGKAR